MIIKCEYCQSFIRGRVATFFSGSVTGNSTTSYLCKKCMKNKNIMQIMTKKHNWILNKMDGL